MPEQKKTKVKFWKCVEAATQFYTCGKVYELVDCPVGTGKGFIADDGLFDLKSMTVSKFKESTEEEFLENTQKNLTDPPKNHLTSV